jgi:hypothetical protein
VVVWNEDGVVRRRTYGARAMPTSLPLDVSSAAKTKMVKEVVAAPIGGSAATLAGYLIAWTDVLSTGPDTDGTSIRVRRLDLNGTPFQGGSETEFTLNTSTGGNQYEPSLAMRSDGSVLAVWTTDFVNPDPGGGIRGRLLLPNLLPVGQDISINTTVADRQEAPSVAPHGADGFVVTFMDWSKAYPDVYESGIRGRIVYPDFSPQSGEIGAACQDGNELTCNGGGKCLSTSQGWRCVERCTAKGSPCPKGGLCKQLSGSGDLVCLFE